MASRSSIWPDFREEWILHEDADLIAIDKPAGVSVEAADPAYPDDIVTRLSRHLAARGDDPYLGIHQRLDRDTSGVLVYARRKSANASLAAQFEKRTTKKTYIAGVVGYDGPQEQVLRHRLLPLTRGRVEVAARNDSRAKDAETRIRVVRTDGDRTLLMCELVTGRTHQIRVQLAAIGSPVAGDALYGDVGAPRMLLHAEEIALAHPMSGTALKLRAKAPPSFNAWLSGVSAPWHDARLVSSLLRDALEARWGLARRDTAKERTNAFRLINEDADGLPGLAVDVYGDHLVAHFYSDEALENRESILDLLDARGVDGVYAKFRPRQANVVIDTRRTELAPAKPLRGIPVAEPVTIYENGIPYLARLGDGLSTGIFLDQRDNRLRVREWARDARVLNLFSYTCAFSSAALLGDAKHVVSVDASADTLAWGKENVALAAPERASRHEVIDADVFETLERLERARAKFDLVIVDPPTYSTTKASRFASGKDWRSLIEMILPLVAPGGRVLACSNDRRMLHIKFRRLLHEGARDARVELAQMKDLHTPRDYPTLAGAESHLKSILLARAP
ncbi:MAG: class I SAM-dependent methyltransferase [Sandaracinaceae bacterium]|nr:class I SAM-dependent methyltransferase [Sandaracinaceae bacterium]